MKNVDIQYGENTNMYRDCAIVFKGKYMIYGVGDNHTIKPVRTFYDCLLVMGTEEY